MGENFVQTRPEKGPLRKEQVYERLSVVGEFVIKIRFFVQNPRFGDLVIVIVVRELSCNKCIKNNA
jgi:hypothetical protein